MRPTGALLGAVLLLGGIAGCGDPDVPSAFNDSVRVSADTTDPALLAPGIIFRKGPADPQVAAGPVYPPVVTGEPEVLSIYDGYFLRAPCSTPLSVEASRGDTITVRLRSRPDTTAPDPCQDSPKPIGYAMLVGPIEPGTYAVRLIHEGDRARPSPLDTVYENITIDAK